MQFHLYLMEEQYLTTAGGVMRTRGRALCSNLATPFNFGVSFATLFAPPTNLPRHLRRCWNVPVCIPIENLQGAKTMSFKKFHPLAVGCVLAVLVSVAPAVLGQVTTTNTQTTQATRDQSLTMRSVPAGSKMKFRGVVISRDADVFTIRDRTRQDYQVLITDNTSIKTNGGFLRSGKRYPVTDILR